MIDIGEVRVLEVIDPIPGLKCLSARFVIDIIYSGRGSYRGRRWSQMPFG